MQSEPPRPGTVLHVAVGTGSGVSAVIADYARQTPELHHHLAIAPDPSIDPGIDFAGLATVHELPRDWGRLVPAFVRLRRHVAPAIVHAHSSKAGVLARSTALVRPPVLYSPHCMAFARRDIGTATRMVLAAAEGVLALRDSGAIAVSPYEERLLRRLPRQRTSRITLVPNLADVGGVVSVAPQSRTIVTVGRVSAAKDPAFFLAVKAAGPVDARWCWLGGGSPADVAALEREGVEVSGWLPRRAVLERLASAAVYLHTAAWEGFPITLLEAAELGVPYAARRIPALEGQGVFPLASTPGELAELVGAVLDGERAALEGQRAFLERHTPAQQRRALLGAYRAALVEAS